MRRRARSVDAAFGFHEGFQLLQFPPQAVSCDDAEIEKPNQRRHERNAADESLAVRHFRSVLGGMKMKAEISAHQPAALLYAAVIRWRRISIDISIAEDNRPEAKMSRDAHLAARLFGEHFD